jgi:hypothetical protein
LEVEGGFDHSCDKPGVEMPVDVAVDDPDAYIQVSFRRQQGGGDISGLSARNLATKFPFGYTMNVSRLIGMGWMAEWLFAS